LFAGASEAVSSFTAAARRMALAMAVLAATASDARASVSVTVTFDDLVRRASAVAVVVPVDQRAVWEDGRIVTYTRVRVERLVAGRLLGEVWLRTFGGAVGHIAQLVEGEATFAGAGASLLFVHPHGEGSSSGIFGVVEGAQGQFALVTSGGEHPRLAAARGVGGLVPPPGAPRLARDVLIGRSLEDAAREIGAAWSQFHATHEER
jgi:hypothetical protein